MKIKENAVIMCNGLEELKECRKRLIEFGFNDDENWNIRRVKNAVHSDFPDMCYVLLHKKENNVQIHTHKCDSVTSKIIAYSELETYLKTVYMKNENYENLTNEQKELVRYWIEKFWYESTVIGTKILEGKQSFTEKYLTPTPVIEVGKAYKYPTNKFLLFIKEKLDEKHVIGYGFNESGEWRSEHKFGILSQVEEATLEEVKERLIEEAKKYIQKSFIRFSDGEKICNKLVNPEFEYHPNGLQFNSKFKGKPCLTLNGNVIMFDGKWAEIIDDKQEIRDKVEVLEAELKELKSML